MAFGQVIIGPPGSGKSTYTEGMRQFLTAIGRNVTTVNLGPANDQLPYPVDIDVRDLVDLDAAAKTHSLGPNGALLYCYEYLAANVDWLAHKLSAKPEAYLLIDMPGQVELYTHHSAVREILQTLQRKHDHRLCAVHLVDAHHCSDAAKYISVLLVTLSTMVQLEMPQINLLSKLDLIESYGQLAFNLDFYMDAPDPARLLPYLEESTGEGCAAFARKHARLSAAICELVDDFGLVQFGAIAISDKETVAAALRSIDKANGYCFASLDTIPNASPFFSVAASDAVSDDVRVGELQERYMTEADLGELRKP